METTENLFLCVFVFSLRRMVVGEFGQSFVACIAIFFPCRYFEKVFQVTHTDVSCDEDDKQGDGDARNISTYPAVPVEPRRTQRAKRNEKLSVFG